MEDGRGHGLNLALGASYSMSPLPNNAYPDLTRFDLTNGVENEHWCEKCNTWCGVGWNERDPRITVNLGTGTIQFAIKRLHLHFSESKHCKISWPRQITLSASMDGIQWTKAATWPSQAQLTDATEILTKYNGKNTMVNIDSQGGWVTMEFGVGISARQIRIDILRGGVWTMLTELNVEA